VCAEVYLKRRRIVKVKVKDLKPNPFRHLESYPIDQAKVAQLSKSIKKTGFWDNIIARKKDGEIQIAYGHHRLEALKKAGETEVDIPVKDLDDETMIRIMADENDDVYAMTPAVLNETVRTVRDYLVAKGKKSVVAHEIRKFLEWEATYKIDQALAALSDIEDGEVDKKAYESLPTVEQASEFRRAIKQAKGKITPENQRGLAKKLIKDGVGSRDIKKEVMHETYRREKGKPSLMEFLYKDLRPKMGSLYLRLQEVDKNKKHIVHSTSTYLFFVECKKLHDMLERVMKYSPKMKKAEAEEIAQLTHKETVNV
jgi:ParB/RepB/Spo0J family partition protein